MGKYVYPAIFTQEENSFAVRFPDLEECVTCGDDLAHAIEMAQDVLPLMLCNREDCGRPIPLPSDIKGLSLESNETASLVACDTVEYRKLYNDTPVKKILTLPTWLNTIAEREGVNFSQILQDALKDRLNVG